MYVYSRQYCTALAASIFSELLLQYLLLFVVLPILFVLVYENKQKQAGIREKFDAT